MRNQLSSLRWGVGQRLEFIEFHLFWEGRVNRADIRRQFGISAPQASKDLTLYQEFAPKNIHYDRSGKHYLASKSFKPLFLKPDADRYLMQLRSVADKVLTPEESWLSYVPSFRPLPMPHRHVDPIILRTVLSTIRDWRSLEIHYQSMSDRRPKPIWRWITPHAFGYDGLRWHIRAFCHIDKRFKDFLLSRILDTRREDEPEARPKEDTEWWDFETITLKPHPGLNEGQQKVVCRDYGMKKGKVTIKVRKALLYYFLKRLGLDSNQESRDPREQHIVLADPKPPVAPLPPSKARRRPVAS